MGVCVSGAAKAVGEDHGGPSAAGDMLGFEEGGVLVDGDCSVVNMSREKAGTERATSAEALG